MSTSTTSAVKLPVAAYSSTIQSSKSFRRSSEINNWRLRNVVLKQNPERTLVQFRVPRLKRGQRQQHVRVGGFCLRRSVTNENSFRDWREVRKNCLSRLAVARPA